MNGEAIQEKVIEAVVIMNTAIINLRLYPPTNDMIMKTVERLYGALQKILEENGTFSLAESERNLLISGEVLTQKNQQKPQVAMFLMLMIKWGMKSISFHKGLEQAELSHFLELMGKKPDDINQEKTLEQFISEGNMPHIRFNQKMFVEVDQDRQIVANLEIKDEAIINYITNEQLDVPLDQAKLKEMAKDPALVSRIFQSGIQQIFERDGSHSNLKLSESMLYMLQTLDKITDHSEKAKLSSLAAKSISDMDADFIAIMLTQNMDGLFDNQLFGQVIDHIDHDKLEQVAGRLYQASNGINVEALEQIQAAQQAYRYLMTTDKGLELQHVIEEKQKREEQEREKRIRELKEKINDILGRFETESLNEDRAGGLPDLLDGLSAEGETATVAEVIDRLIAMLHREDPDIRNTASRALAGILDHLSREQCDDVLIRHADGLIRWLTSETTGTAAFRRIAMLHKNLIQTRIRNHQFPDNFPLLEAFHLISSGPNGRDDRIRSAVSETFREVLSPEILGILIEEFRTDKQNQRDEAGKTLVMMAEQSIDPLLDLLLECDDTSERILILNLIPEMGNAAVPAIIARMNERTPWYFLRNLARLLGRIGNEEHAKTALAPLLSYGDLRVQREAFKSIGSTGGAARGEIFLSALFLCDDQLKANIVAALGSLKHRGAVAPLQTLFKSKTGLPEEMKVDLQEKICLALGNIGEKEALPFLKEVTTQLSIFSFKSYHPKVKAAAGRAVGQLSQT